TTQNIDTGQGWSETNVIINGCQFFNVKKRAVKVLAAGITIRDCKVYSEYDDFTNCPGNAFELFGGKNKVINNYVDLKRALTAIRIAGPDNLIEGNTFYVDKTGEYRTEGTSLGTTISGLLTGRSPLNVDTPNNNIIRGNII